MNLERSFDINLLDFPAGVDGTPRRRRVPALWLVVAGLMAVAWWGTWGWYALQERSQETELAHLQEKARLTASEGRTQSEAAARRKALDLKAQEIRKIEARMVLSSEVLSRLESSIPPGVRLTAIAAGGGELSCKGVAADYPALAAFVRSAEQREYLSEARCAMSEAADDGIRFEVLLKISQN